jgi:hypothetical protein
MKPGSVVSYCIENFIALFYFKKKHVRKSVFRIRIGSGLNLFSGSEFGIRIQEGKNGPQK